MSPVVLIGIGCIGAAVAMTAWSGAESFGRGMDFVESDFRDKLRRLRVGTSSLRGVLSAWLGFVATMFVVCWIIFQMPVIGLMISVLLVSLPWYLLRRMAERRRLQIEDQLADAMVSLSSAIRAGLSLAQAMEILAQQTPKPICQEFQQLHGEYRLGKPMDQCLVEAKERLKSENFALFAAAMQASRESGGRLNETVDRIAHSVRELQRLERKIQSETAQARASAFYMALAPFAILAIYWLVVAPEDTERLFTTFWGQIMLSAAMFLNVTAYLWARKILAADI